MLKYDSTMQDYVRARAGDERSLRDHDSFSANYAVTDPQYYRTMVKQNPKRSVRGLGILPVPTQDFDNGGYIRYVETPAKLELDTDTPYQLPEVAHILIPMAVISDVWEAKGDWSKAERAFNRYLYQEDEFLKSYQPQSSDRPVATHFGDNRAFSSLVYRRRI